MRPILFLAHQSGWDELLLFLGPVILMLAWLRWAEKRARRRRDEAQEASSNMPSDTDA
jgi:cytochrome c-type biogenesis protein CcmH/NrfF